MAKRVKLNQFCEKVATIATSYNGTIDYIDISAVDNKSKSITSTQTINSIEAPSRAKQLIKNGDVLVSTVRPNLNAVAYVDLETSNLLVASTGYCVLRFTEDLDARYAFYFCQSPYFIDDMVAQATGASYPAVSTSIVKSSMIPLYVKKQQQRIAAVLDKVSELIDLRKRQLAKLDELVKSQFIELFGSPFENNHGWDMGTIRDIVSDVRYGSSRKASPDGKYPYLRMNNITYGGELDLSDVKRIDIPDDELEKCSVRRGDVLFNRTNSKELVGKTCMYDRDELMVLAGFVIRVRLNNRAIPEFLAQYMNLPHIKELLLSMCKAACGQANINAQEFQDIPIYIPPVEKQQAFVGLKEQSDKSKAVVQQSLDKLETLKKSLMQEYFG